MHPEEFVRKNIITILNWQGLLMQPNTQIQHLDRAYRDPRGVLVHVTGFDREQQQEIFTRPGYEHECMRPVWQFQQLFRRVSE